MTFVHMCRVFARVCICITSTLFVIGVLISLFFLLTDPKGDASGWSSYMVVVFIGWLISLLLLTVSHLDKAVRHVAEWITHE